MIEQVSPSTTSEAALPEESLHGRASVPNPNIAKLRGLASQAFDPVSFALSADRVPPSLIAVAIADRDSLAPAITEQVVELFKRPEGTSMTEVAKLDVLENLYLSTHQNEVLAASGLYSCDPRGASKDFVLQGRSFGAYGWADQYEHGWYIRENLENRRSGFFVSAVFREFDADTEAGFGGGSATLLQVRNPAVVQNVKLFLPGNAVLTTDFRSAEQGKVTWVMEDSAFQSTLRALSAESLINGAENESAKKTGIARMVLALSDEPGELTVTFATELSEPGRELLKRHVIDPELRQDPLVARALAIRHVREACLMESVNYFIPSRVDGGVYSAVKYGSHDTARLQILQAIDHLYTSDEEGSIRSHLTAEIQTARALFQRALHLLPRFTGEFHFPFMGCPGFGNAASVDFGTEKSMMHYSYAMVIGGPTPAPHSEEYNGPNPFRGYYTTSTDSGEKVQVLVDPAFQEQLLDFMRRSARGEPEKVAEYVRSIFVTTKPEQAMEVLPAAPHRIAANSQA